MWKPDASQGFVSAAEMVRPAETDWTPKKSALPQTKAICPYKEKFIDEVLARESRGEPIVSPRPEPKPFDPNVDTGRRVFRGRSGRIFTVAKLKATDDDA